MIVKTIKYILGLALVFCITYPIHWAFSQTSYDLPLFLVYYVVLSIFSAFYLKYVGSNIVYKINKWANNIIYFIPRTVTKIYNAVPILWLAFVVPLYLYIICFIISCIYGILSIFVKPVLAYFAVSKYL